MSLGFNPQKLAELVESIRWQLFRLALMEMGLVSNGHGRPVLTVKADTEAVVRALEAHLTPEEIRRIQWVIRG